MDLISNKYKSIGELISSRRLKNIVVISKSGEIIGKVREVRMKDFKVEGIILVKHLNLSPEFIDRSFIKVFTQNEVLLNINPVTTLKGLSVYDSSGRELGKVRKILRADNKNNFTSLVVKHRFYSRPILIPKDKIDVMKKNIVLNIDYLEYSNHLKEEKKRKKK
jgi:sporulation protein YlmC with PRC-barrel domain